jgi:hypothetical protein
MANRCGTCNLGDAGTLTADVSGYDGVLYFRTLTRGGVVSRRLWDGRQVLPSELALLQYVRQVDIGRDEPPVCQQRVIRSIEPVL